MPPRVGFARAVRRARPRFASGGHLVLRRASGPPGSLPRIAPCWSAGTRSERRSSARWRRRGRAERDAGADRRARDRQDGAARLRRGAGRRDAAAARPGRRVRGPDPVRLAARAAAPRAGACSTGCRPPRRPRWRARSRCGPGAAQERFAVGAATLEPARGLRRAGPVAVLVDDAQWLDGSSAQALLFALRRLVADPIAVLIAVRDGEPSLLDGADLPTLRLGGLTSGEARRTAARARRRTTDQRLHARRPATRWRCSSSPPRPASLRSRPRARRCSSRRGSRARSCAGPASLDDGAARGRWCWPRPATAATWRCSSRAAAQLGVELAALAGRRERRTGHACGAGRSSFAIRWRARRSTRDAPVERAAPLTARSPRRCRTATSTAARGTSRRRRSGTDDAASAALEQAGAREPAIAAPTRPRPRRSSGRRGSPPTAERRASLLWQAAEAAWLAGLADRAVALLDEARASGRRRRRSCSDRPAGGPHRDPPGAGDAGPRDPDRGGRARPTRERAVAMLAEAADACFSPATRAEMLAVAERRSRAAACRTPRPAPGFWPRSRSGWRGSSAATPPPGPRRSTRRSRSPSARRSCATTSLLLPWLAMAPMFAARGRRRTLAARAAL